MVTILKKKDVSVLPRKNGENIEKNKARVEFEPDHNIFFAAEEKEPRLKRRLQRTIKWRAESDSYIFVICNHMQFDKELFY